MASSARTARQIAFDILMAADAGAYAADLLARDTARLDSRDAGLAGSIVLGVLRHLAQLDFLIERLARRPARKLDREVLTALRMGVFQLRYLDRVPPHAAVAESVELVKRAKKKSAAPFANAVLRKVTREPVEWPDRATELSHPEWMLARWSAQFGRETAESIARTNLEVPKRYIRVPSWVPAPEGAEATEIEGAFLAPAALGLAPAALGLATDGFRVQDIGSQSVVPLLDLAPGQTFLDVCAAPGNKTAQALESAVNAVACDVHWSRLSPLTSLEIPLVVIDAEKPLPFGRGFDRILVDAPCTGTGTLAHNPEIKWRLKPEGITELAAVQKRILRNAMDVLAPGGLLVYSTCSLEVEENEKVVEEVAGGRVRKTVRRTPGQQPGDGFFAALIQ